MGARITFGLIFYSKLRPGNIDPGRFIILYQYYSITKIFDTISTVNKTR